MTRHHLSPRNRAAISWVKSKPFCVTLFLRYKCAPPAPRSQSSPLFYHDSRPHPAASCSFLICISSSILHLFPWTGIITENQELSATFRLPDLKTGRMVRLLSQLSRREEEMFRNMIRRMDTIVKVETYINTITPIIEVT